ncbi:M17 family metallopeptidase [Pleomorphomonas sp. PLEO]|uniref:leucyl aminopeptidase family protein n=1 Tax=Pleomorphomonas sp. PLEO TaxID=3239306 RepID=UPI00351F2F56
MLSVFAAADEVAIPVHAVTVEGLESKLTELGAAAWAKANAFSADEGTVLLLPNAEGEVATVLFGLGREGSNRPPLLAGKLATALPAGTYRLEGWPGGFGEAALAFALGAYRFERYLKPKTNTPRLVLPEGEEGAEAERIAAAVFMVRDLVNTPANDLGPAELAAAARELATAHGAVFEEYIGEDLLAREFPLIEAVGRGSPRQARLITFTWGRVDAPKVSLVGKGVVFDTGGLDIKGGSYMLLMKKDMGGAANVLGLARLIMEADLDLRLRVVLPIVENAVSGTSFRPGDVFPSRKGLTVQIGDTDAEGRLILADALAFADDEAPDLLVDLATLTGAARVALGPDIPPFYTRDDAFAADLSAASLAAGDPLWRLPLWAPYEEGLKSKIADLNNVAPGGFAGSITAALFLGRFVDKAKTWMHGDIFAWVPAARPGQPEGGEAQAIRALYRYLKDRFGRA